MKRRAFLTASLAVAASSKTLFAKNADMDSAKENVANRVERNAHGFVHPGIFQTAEQLEFMKRKILAAEQPWAAKWDALLKLPGSSLSFRAAPVTHLVRQAGGTGKKGDDELRASTDAARGHVLQWYVTGDAAHAEKAAEILDAWASTLWDFDGNDAKLTAGWTGASLCESAEILRATYPAWGAEREQRFRRFLIDVYLPIEQDMFSEANGNWDAAIMHTLAAIAIFTDDRPLFDRVLEHYRFGKGNGGIVKYVYSSGQCSESTRDMGHTQLGLGHFANVAHICWNQGVDLFCIADDRLALGFEYTSKYMLGEDVPYFGDISSTGRERFTDFYEAVYQYYRYVRGRSMPYTEKAMLRAREHAQNTLIFYRGEVPETPHALLPAPQLPTVSLPGALQESLLQPPADAIRIKPGESIQTALDAAGKKGGGTIYLEAGFHSAEQSLLLPSRVTIAGAGRSTILSLAPQARGYCIVNASANLRDVVLRDFILEGATSPKPPQDPNQDRRARMLFTAPSRGGIQLSGNADGSMQTVRLERVTVRNCTMSAVELEGATRVSIADCDFSESGADVIPGAGQHHNLRVHFCSEVVLQHVRLDSSPAGCGLSARSVRNISVANCEAARNRCDGLRFYSCEGVSVAESLLEGNDGAGIKSVRDGRDSAPFASRKNAIQYNGADALRC